METVNHMSGRGLSQPLGKGSRIGGEGENGREERGLLSYVRANRGEVFLFRSLYIQRVPDDYCFVF